MISGGAADAKFNHSVYTTMVALYKSSLSYNIYSGLSMSNKGLDKGATRGK